VRYPPFFFAQGTLINLSTLTSCGVLQSSIQNPLRTSGSSSIARCWVVREGRFILDLVSSIKRVTRVF